MFSSLDVILGVSFIDVLFMHWGDFNPSTVDSKSTRIPMLSSCRSPLLSVLGGEIERGRLQRALSKYMNNRKQVTYLCL